MYLLLFVILLNIGANAQNSSSIQINIPENKLYLLDSEKKVLKTYPVALGKSNFFATPEGNHKIISKTKNPGWRNPSTGRTIEPGKNNPLGTRWLGFFQNSQGQEFGIHGSSKVNSIGRFASHGCVRMHIKDSEELFDLVQIGTPVDVTYQRSVLKLNSSGDLILTLYPDFYKKQKLSVADIQVLIKNKYTDIQFINNKTIEMMLSNANRHRLPMTRVIGY